MSAHYDDILVNANVLLDLPFEEGSGILVHDLAKPHHPVTLVSTPSWEALASGKMAINLDGEADYGQCVAASCEDLDFTSGAYSLGGWLKWTVDEYSQIVMARYELSVSGWELYLTQSAGGDYLTLRHHHAGTLVPLVTGNPRTGAYSLGWTPDTLFHFGVSRDGDSAQFYRNGEAVATVSDELVDPETCDQDLVIGVRYSKNANFYKGPFPRLFVASGALTAKDWRNMYESQVGYYAT